MKLNKEKFLKTEFGSKLQECVTAWDHWLTELDQFTFNASSTEYKRVRKAADWCQAQWDVYQMAMKQFYGIDFYFKRTEQYFGVYAMDESCYLFEIDREV